VHQKDPQFWRSFTADKQWHAHPRLNRWTLCFTALDLARSLGAQRSLAFLESVGAPSKNLFRRCRIDCTGIYIADEEFLAPAGVNIDGRALQTQGYYCAKCAAFQTW
jgi:hypothetical protein